MSPEIQPADARLRIRVLLAMTLLAAAGTAGLLVLDGYLDKLDSGGTGKPLAAERALAVVRWFLALMAAGGVMLGLYLGWISWRTLRSERFPPPGVRVISDTRIRRGREARRHGQAGLALAAATLLLTVFVALRAHRLFASLLDTSLKPTPFDLPAARPQGAGTSDGRTQISPEGGR